MKEEVKKETNGRDIKGKDRKSFNKSKSPNGCRDRSRSPVERKKDLSSKAQRRVYVANVAFDVKWSDLKDLFREKIGNVSYCQLFEDEEGRSRGCGLVEFQDAASAKKAIEELHRFNYKGRELVVKEDVDCERDRYGRLILNKKDKDRDNQRDRDGRNDDRRNLYDQAMRQQGYSTYNTYGLSPQFLESLGISGPLNNRIFVANLDYKVGEKKLEEIFRLAGKVLRVRLYTDSSGTSKGHGTVEFEHPVEAVQAISMFHDQNLYGRPMSIRMDKYECEEMPEVLPSKLPSGLESVGKGLGIGGQPLNISKSLLNSSITPQSIVPTQTPQVPTLSTQPVAQSAQPQISSYSISGLTNSLGQQAVGLTQSIQNPQVNQGITSGLNTLGLGNLSASSLTANLASNQNLNQLANTAQNVLAAAASLSANSLNPSLGLATNQAQNALFSNYEREFRDDKFRNGAANQSNASTNQNVDSIFVKNLPPNFSWQNLRDRFNEIGEVRYAELKRGVAVVRFHSNRDAQRAVEVMNGIRIDNRPIEVGLYY